MPTKAPHEGLKTRVRELEQALADAKRESNAPMNRDGLAAGEKRFRTSVENTLDGVCICRAIRDGKGNIEGFRIEYANRAVCKMTRKSKEALEGHRLREVFPAHRESGLFNAYCRVVNSNVPLTKKAFFHEEQINGKKLKRVFDVQAVKLDDGFTSAWRDVTDEVRLRKESAQHLQQVIQADRLASLGEVVAGVAHEINNPNSFIAYNVPLLEEIWQDLEPILKKYGEKDANLKIGKLSMGEMVEDMKAVVESIKIGSDRITQVVRNLKDFARLDDSPETRPVQINEVIEKTLTIVGAQLRSCAENISVNLEASLPEIDGHFGKLEQVVANLLTNATHALPRKDNSLISVTSRYVKRLGTVTVAIEDNGTGIPSDVIKNIFEPFYTTRRATGGTGLGLSISYRIIQEHNGFLGVQTRPGVGTRFTLFLPVDRFDKPNIESTILCVDDEPAVLKMLESIFLNARLAPVETIKNPEGVLAYLKEHPEIDMIFSDIVMPEMNGWTLFEKIKAYDPLIPMILYSGYPEELEKASRYPIQPDFLLQKPFRAETLLKIVHSTNRQIR